MSQILVIDDDNSIVDVMQLLLERDGHRVFGATDVGEAVTALQQFAVDIVITDVHHVQQGRHPLHNGASAQDTTDQDRGDVRKHEARPPRESPTPWCGADSRETFYDKGIAGCNRRG